MKSLIPFFIPHTLEFRLLTVKQIKELSRVHHTFHVSNLKKCYADEPLVMPLEGIHVDNKLQFVEEPVEIMEREIKRLKRSRIPLVKVRWNSRRGPEFTWEREDSFKQKYPQLFTNRASSSTTRFRGVTQENKEKKEEGREETAKDSRKKMLGRKRAGKEQQKESLKKQKVKEVEEDDEVELNKLLVIKKDEDIAIDAIPLATKLPVIIDYKLHKEGMLVHYELIRANGSSKRYSSMIRMLQGIDREDLEPL
ncbi:hypothetical protein Tco_0637825 [Tanacetum coccineum]